MRDEIRLSRFGDAAVTRQRLHEEIAAFAEAHAGTELDLDEDLERAGIEALRNEDRQ